MQRRAARIHELLAIAFNSLTVHEAFIPYIIRKCSTVHSFQWITSPLPIEMFDIGYGGN
jgi:hypothetical protein